MKELNEATDTLDKVGTSPKPGLIRSNSSPALITMGEPTNLPTLSPRSVARSFLEDAAQKPGSYKDPSFLSKRYSQDVPSELWSSPGIEKTDRDVGRDQEDGLLQTSGSSEFVDISYKDIENEESKATAKPASSTAPGDSTTDAVDDSAAISKTTPNQVEEHEPKAEKPKTLSVVPHLSQEDSIQEPRKLLNYRPRGHTVSIMVHRDRPKGQQGDSRSRRTSEAKHRGSFTQKDSYRSGINPR